VAAKGVPQPTLAVLLGALLLIVGGLSLALGWRGRVGVGAMVLFLAPVTMLMHNFWALEGFDQMLETFHFLANVALLGSLLMFVGIRDPWPFSVDEWLVSTRSPGIGQPDAAIS
jgi:putative oxidoreductase